MIGRSFFLFSSLIVSAAVALAGCAADVPDASSVDGASAALTTVSVTPAKFECKAPQAIDLEIVTTRTKVTVTAKPGDNDASGTLHADGHADLGGFLSEDHGTYSIKLDAKMLRGEAGRAVLSDEEPGDDVQNDTYTCELAANDAPVKTCRDGALASSHLQPGKKGGPDAKSVVACEPGFTLCRIDPNGPDNDVCGDPDDCFACSK
jgi:hypothetical protein